jgi:uncharacterized membrane protein YeaQ/YmgE (transglycosylase-associated protein family)
MRKDIVHVLDSYASLLVLLLANFFLLELVDDPRWGAIGSTLLAAAALVVAISEPEAWAAITAMTVSELVILGLLAGYIAKALMPGKDPGGFFVTILLGLAGSLVGFFIFTELLGIGDDGLDGIKLGDRASPGAAVGSGRPLRCSASAAACPGAETITGQAAQANSDFERPVLPSYSMPKALICDRVASAAVNSDATGWKTPVNRTGSPVSSSIRCGTSMWSAIRVAARSAPGFLVQTPWGPRKSGIPDSVEIPAPVRITMPTPMLKMP